MKNTRKLLAVLLSLTMLAIPMQMHTAAAAFSTESLSNVENSVDAMLGRLNEDTDVNSKDAVLVLKDSAYFGTYGTHQLSEEQVRRADVNGDNLINASDATCIFVYAAKHGADASTPDFPQYMKHRLAMETQAADPDTHFYGAKYCRTSEYYEENTILLIQSREELEARFPNPDAWAKAHNERMTDILQAYDEAFFAEKNLILLEREVGSGSIRMEVSDITAQNGLYTVHLNLYEPQIGTCDMARWYIFAETDKGITDAGKISTMVDVIREES